MSNEITVADIFRRAQEIKKSSPNTSYSDISARLASEFGGKAFPSAAKLTIPEQDLLVPEEDWTAGLPIILRGIQTEDWDEIAHGTMICLEQVENFQIECGSENAPEKEWHNREKGIEGIEAQTTSKWLPADLMAMAQKNVRK